MSCGVRRFASSRDQSDGSQCAAEMLVAVADRETHSHSVSDQALEGFVRAAGHRRHTESAQPRGYAAPTSETWVASPVDTPRDWVSILSCRTRTWAHDVPAASRSEAERNSAWRSWGEPHAGGHTGVHSGRPVPPRMRAGAAI